MCVCIYIERERGRQREREAFTLCLGFRVYFNLTLSGLRLQGVRSLRLWLLGPCGARGPRFRASADGDLGQGYVRDIDITELLTS